MGELRTLSLAPVVATPRPDARSWSDPANFDSWRLELRNDVLGHVSAFVSKRCTAELADSGVEVAADILLTFVAGGKCLRSTFMYLGWLCGAPDSDQALFASAGLELLHAFALLQDDVMDSAPSRRGRPSAHLQFSQWHRHREMSGTAERFGESAAILLGDLCLIWAEQMLRESGLDHRRLERAWPRYDAMRTELAVGQFADLASDIRNLPSMDAVLAVARRKSGNYTVRRPLEIGAAMSNCADRTVTGLGQYGEAVGEAFQLRDDLLGVFGAEAVTGKPDGQDLVERKATSVVIATHQLADRATRAQLRELMDAELLDRAAIERCRELIVGTGAVQRIEDMIDSRVTSALDALDALRIDDSVHAALTNMAAVCTERVE